MRETFHVVKRLHGGKFATYAVYADNEPFLEPAAGKVLGRREAYAVARLLNEGPWR